MVGASRERVNKAIASFVRLGWLEQNNRRYVITNREQLSIRSRALSMLLQYSWNTLKNSAYLERDEERAVSYCMGLCV